MNNMVQISMHVNAKQRARIDKLPRGVKLSALFREHFDEVLVDYPEDKEEEDKEENVKIKMTTR